MSNFNVTGVASRFASVPTLVRNAGGLLDAPSADQGQSAAPSGVDTFAANLPNTLHTIESWLGNLWATFQQRLGSAGPTPATPAPTPALVTTAPAPAKPSPSQPATYTVRSGDSLASIAARVLGSAARWTEIYNLNRDQVSNPNLIHPGQVLKLPGNSQPSTPAPVPAPAASTFGNPNAFFMTQYLSKWNPDGPNSSANCGPTSLAMALKALGKAPPGGNPNDPEQFIEKTRLAMTGADNIYGDTTCSQVLHGAQAAGAKASTVNGVAGVDQALAQGQLVVACGDPIGYEHRLNGSQYGNNARFDGGHFILVVAKQGDNYVIDDPMSRVGSMTISRQELANFMAYQGWNTGIAVGR